MIARDYYGANINKMKYENEDKTRARYQTMCNKELSETTSSQLFMRMAKWKFVSKSIKVWRWLLPSNHCASIGDRVERRRLRDRKAPCYVRRAQGRFLSVLLHLLIFAQLNCCQSTKWARRRRTIIMHVRLWNVNLLWQQSIAAHFYSSVLMAKA